MARSILSRASGAAGLFDAASAEVEAVGACCEGADLVAAVFAWEGLASLRSVALDTGKLA